jgi:SAM-dependent methyltransferase
LWLYGVVAGFETDVEQMMLVNQANWDQRAPIHAASGFYGLDGSREPDSWFADYEWRDLGPLDGVDLVHLQCHLGVESVALARRGARVVGLDISGESVVHARSVAGRFGVGVEYVQANVYDAVEALGYRTFDVIYTGKGALCYLPDLAAWAEVVARLLRPGGVLYLVEFHPLLYSLGVVPPADNSQELLLRNDYLGGGGVEKRDATYTYTDGPPLPDARTAYEWRHGVGDVVSALVGAGLSIDHLRESATLPWPRWRGMVRQPDGWFRLPDTMPRIPLLYALSARKVLPQAAGSM